MPISLPHHSDISLLTIIPTAVGGDDDDVDNGNYENDDKVDGKEGGQGGSKGGSQGGDGPSGLHCWDLKTGLWLDMEKHAPPGDLNHHTTSHHITPHHTTSHHITPHHSYPHSSFARPKMSYLYPELHLHLHLYPYLIPLPLPLFCPYLYH